MPNRDTIKSKMQKIDVSNVAADDDAEDAEIGDSEEESDEEESDEEESDEEADESEEDEEESDEEADESEEDEEESDEEADESEEDEEESDEEEKAAAKKPKPDAKDKQIAALSKKLEKARMDGVNAALEKIGIAEKYRKYAHQDMPNVDPNTAKGKKQIQKWAKERPEMRGRPGPMNADVKKPPLIKVPKRNDGFMYNEKAHRRSVEKLERHGGRK